MTSPEGTDGSGGALVHAPGRRATWFELFFDLVFVAGVAQLASGFAGAHDPGGGLRFVGVFLVLSSLRATAIAPSPPAGRTSRSRSSPRACRWDWTVTSSCPRAPSQPQRS